MEVTYIRTVTPIVLIVHPPESDRDKGELARRIAELHADLVIRKIREIKCSSGQKMELVDRLLADLASD